MAFSLTTALVVVDNMKYNVVLEENLSYSVSSCGKAINVNKCTQSGPAACPVTGFEMWIYEDAAL